MASSSANKIILITGATGLLGTALCHHLKALGYQIKILTRKKKQTIPFQQYLWNPTQNQLDIEAVKDVYAVIHLGGASIAGHRWTKSHKEELYTSRIGSTRYLVDALLTSGHIPALFISASGMAIYGDRGGEIVTENSTVVRNTFLSDLSNDWEHEALQLSAHARTVMLRTGLVCSTQDGIYAKSLLPAQLGIAPVFGSGSQIYSWIHIADFVHAVAHIISHTSLQGAVNMASPNPASQYQFSKQMARSYRPWSIPLPIPAFLLKIILGELAGSMLESIHMYPQKLLEHGFKFKYIELSDAFAALKEERK